MPLHSILLRHINSINFSHGRVDSSSKVNNPSAYVMKAWL